MSSIGHRLYPEAKKAWFSGCLPLTVAPKWAGIIETRVQAASTNIVHCAGGLFTFTDADSAKTTASSAAGNPITEPCIYLARRLPVIGSNSS